MNSSPTNQATSRRKEPRWTSTFLPALGFTSVLGLALASFGYAIHSEKSEVPLTALICLLAYIVGIPLGMAASPYEKEGSHFKTIGGLIASFVSGLVASKVAALDFAATFLDSPLKTARTILFVSFFILGVVQTFMFRRYYDATRPREQYGEREQAPAQPSAPKSTAPEGAAGRSP